MPDIVMRLFANNANNIVAHTRCVRTEYVTGIPPARIVQCHGGFRSASCIQCGKACSSTWYRDEIEAGRIPRCTSRDDDGEECGGLCKADITFFGEGLPKEFSERKKQVQHANTVQTMYCSFNHHPIGHGKRGSPARLRD